MSLAPDTNIFGLPPCKAGVVGAWMFGKAFLIPALIAMPLALSRKDWTWFQFIEAFGVSISIGFLPCFVGSVLWHSIGEVPYLRTAVCWILPMPLAALPCLAVFAMDLFDNLAFSLLVASWLLLVAAFVVLPPFFRLIHRLSGIKDLTEPRSAGNRDSP
jgi:hypothetical protein